MKKYFQIIQTKLASIAKTRLRILLPVLVLIIFTITSFLIYQTTHKSSADKTSSFHIQLNLDNLETASPDLTTISENSDTTLDSADETTLSEEQDTTVTQPPQTSSVHETSANHADNDLTKSTTAQTTTPPTETQTTTLPVQTEAPEQTTPSAPVQNPAPVPQDMAQAILARMSLEEKVGQMFIARCPAKNAAQSAADYSLGGYILFARDFEGRTKEQVIQNIQSYQSAASIPMLIGVDEEGGAVNRISRYPQFRPQPFLSPQDLFLAGGLELIQSDTVEKCQLLRELGLNLNFAPVCDVSENPDDFIYRRTFGRNASETAGYAETVVRIMKQQQMGSVLKHFPGYGNNADTHTGIAYDNRPYETFITSDFLPFQSGINAGADIVMVSHNIVNCMDSQTPASLSPRVHEILRSSLGFSGVIITDELSMNGVLDYADDASIAIMAIQAGNDLLCCTNFDTQIPSVLNAVRQGTISEARINESVLRILRMKISLGIIQS